MVKIQWKQEKNSGSFLSSPGWILMSPFLGKGQGQILPKSTIAIVFILQNFDSL